MHTRIIPLRFSKEKLRGTLRIILFSTSVVVPAPRSSDDSRSEVVDPTGFEPVTSSLQMRRSTN